MSRSETVKNSVLRKRLTCVPLSSIVSRVEKSPEKSEKFEGVMSCKNNKKKTKTVNTIRTGRADDRAVSLATTHNYVASVRVPVGHPVHPGSRSSSITRPPLLANPSVVVRVRIRVVRGAYVVDAVLRDLIMFGCTRRSVGAMRNRRAPRRSIDSRGPRGKRGGGGERARTRKTSANRCVRRRSASHLHERPNGNGVRTFY